MRLSCQKAFVLAVVFTAACGAPNAPPLVIGLFTLETVDSRPVPLVVRSEGADTLTLLSAIVTFDAAGKARFTVHTRSVTVPDAPREATNTARYSYTIVGDSITFNYDPPCPPNALCVRPPYGKLTSTTLTLFYRISPDASIPYVYRMTEQY
jgi:hypothetical protein